MLRSPGALLKTYRHKGFCYILCLSAIVNSFSFLVRGIDVQMIKVQLNAHEVVPYGD